MNSPAALKSIRAARPDGAPIYVIMDNPSAYKGTKIRTWAKKNKVELCFTPTNASWANPIEAHFGPLRQFTLANSHHPNHAVQTRALHTYLRWRNANARPPASWPHNAKNAPASVARRASAGADAPSPAQRDRARSAVPSSLSADPAW
ncbi:transposase [Streptomyces scopuliridis]|uniref:transposase n=1 Tax=Streptomyces scopuliridis TaxID=452529 RepID=UPI0036B1A6A9